MRISILTLTFTIIISSFSYGQIQKGTWTLNGDLSSSYPGYRDYTPRLYDFRLQSEGSYFITKNINLGANIGIDYYKFFFYSALPIPDTLSTVDLTSTLKVRYYINPNQKVKVYGQIDPGLGFSFTFQNRKEEVQGFYGIPEPPRKYRRREFLLTPNLEVGFNYFISKNIAFETALNYRLFYREKRFSFIDDEYIGSDLTFYPDDLWTPHVGMRFFFNVEDDGQSLYSPETYLKKGNLTFGLNLGHSAFISPGNIDFAPYHSSAHISYFLLDRWAVGAALHYAVTYGVGAIGVVPSVEYYFPINPKLQIVPSLESYIGTATQWLTLEDHYGDFGSIFNLGIKANYFVGENISIWGGPFFNRSRAFFDDPVYHINLKGGFRY